MKYAAFRFVLFLALVGAWSAAPNFVRAESDAAALAGALKDTTTTLQGWLKASEKEGTPISAKFEIETESCSSRSIR